MNVRLLGHRQFAGLLTAALLVLSALSSGQSLAASLASGRFHGLLARDDGTVAAWGYNAFGQVGDGSYIDRSFPVAVIGLNGVNAVAGGSVHSLALKTDGTVWGWGNNSDGQLGDATTVRRVLPVKVASLTSVTAIAAGYDHSMALRSDGTVWAWGKNDAGQLGDGSTTGRLLPVRVSGLTNIVAVAGGDAHSLALRNDGTVWAWGDNTSGQMGDGTTTPQRLTAVQVKGLAGIARIATNGAHNLALQSDNSVWAWGDNYYGQLGNGTSQNYYILANKVAGVTGVVALSAGNGASYVKRVDGAIWAWGDNYYGQLGDGTTTQRNGPVPVPNGTAADQIAAGAAHFSTMKTDGTIMSMGQNVIGQLGDATLVQIPAPIAITSITNVAKLAPGFRHSLGIRNDGTVVGWGDNSYGQLGDNTYISKGSPTPVSGLSSVVSVASGITHSVALKADGSVWTWGDNGSGQLGTSVVNYSPIPVQVPGLTGVTAIGSGYYHVVALKSDGSLWAWGANYSGQLGDGTITNRNAPTRVQAGNCIGCPLAVGGGHALVLRADGTLVAWGSNASGQLGDGTTTDRLVPITVPNFNGVTAISAGGFHSLAMRTGATVWGWGFNRNGQLGNGSYDNATTPTQITGATGVASVVAGGFHSMGLMADGTVLAWGSGGIVGDGTDRDLLSPTPLSFIGPVDKIAVGQDHTLAVTRAGVVMGWGGNYSQKLGVPFAVQTQSLVKTRDPMARIAGSDIVVEYFNPTIKNGAGTSGFGHYFVSANPIEQVSIDNGGSGPGWQRTGRVFRAWLPGPGGAAPSTAPAGAAPVYRFYAGQPNSHFYTAIQAEYQSLRNLNPTNNPAVGWAFESIEFYTVLPQASGACGAGYQPVYRAYNNRFNPNAVLNDGNHRVTPSAIDYQRSIAFLGYTGEGVAFCSPVTTDAVADLHGWYIYPGSEAQSGSQIYVLFVFSNNGPGDGTNARAYMALPTEVTNWTICVNATDINCAGTAVDPAVLRSGQLVTSFSAGGILTVLAKGTAPQVIAGGNATLKFGAYITNAAGAPDANRSNNAPLSARTLVKAPQVCNFSLTPANVSLGTTAQGSQVAVLTSAGCQWSVQNSVPWLNVTPTSGSGNFGVLVTPQINTSAAARSGTLTVGGQTLTVTQAGVACTYAASPSSLTLSSNAQNAQVALTAPTGCAWTAQGSAPWFAVSPTSGSNGTTLTLSIASNALAASRTGSISIGGLSIPIVQSGTVEAAVAPPPPPNPCATFRLQRDGDQMPADGLSGESAVAVYADSICTWNSQSAAPWLTITTGAAGSGNGTLKYVVQPNSDPKLRIGTITSGGRSFTITQQGRDTTTRDTGSDSGGDSSGGGGGGGGSGGGGGGGSGGGSG